jgi:hypothetical protein
MPTPSLRTMQRLASLVLGLILVSFIFIPTGVEQLTQQDANSAPANGLPEYVLDTFESLNATGVSFVVSMDVSSSGMVGCAEFSGTLSNSNLMANGVNSNGGKDVLLFGWNESTGFWSTTLGGIYNEFCWKVRWTAPMEFAISGYHEGYLQVGSTNLSHHGARDAFVAIYNISMGQWEAANNVGTSGQEEFRSFTLLSNGSYVAVGTSNGNISSNSTIPGAEDCTTPEVTYTPTCTMLVYFDANLNPTGMKVLKSTTAVIGSDVIEISQTRQVLVAGYFSGNLTYNGAEYESLGSSDIFVIRYSNQGQESLLAAFGGQGNDEARSIARTSTGFALGGTTESTNISQSSVYKPTNGWQAPVGEGGKDNLILLLSPLGLISDGYTFGTEKSDAVGEIAVDERDYVYMTGYIGSNYQYTQSNTTYGILNERSAYLAIINFSGGNTTQIVDFYASTGSNNGDGRTNAVAVLQSDDVWLGGRIVPGSQTNSYFGEHTSGFGHGGFILRIGLDVDADDFAKRLDNCPIDYNPTQSNHDADQLGDVCDIDDDNDGIDDINDIICQYSISELFISTPESDHDGDGCEDQTEDMDDDNDGFSDVQESIWECPKGVTNWTAGNPNLDRDSDGCHDELEDQDDDGDSFIDDVNDTCAESNSTVYDSNTWIDSDLDGCHNDEDNDLDNDGKLNAFDGCDASPIPWKSNATNDYDQDGCVDAGEDIDDDDDGVHDVIDDCDPDSGFASILGTSEVFDWEDHDGDGCHDLEDPDKDNDGYLNVNDRCPLGMTGWSNQSEQDYDEDGCQDDEDADDDDDGVFDEDDVCDPDSGFQSRIGWNSNSISDHDRDGCADAAGDNSEIEEDFDDDGDGIADIIDGLNGECSRSNLDLPPEDYDNDGCFDDEDSDIDGDGISNILDGCERGLVPPSGKHLLDYDGDGCADDSEDTDTDGDGIPNLDDEDKCPNGDFFNSTKANDWDSDGCKDSTEDDDDDGDGILDTEDKCDPENGFYTNNLPWKSNLSTDFTFNGCRDAGAENGNYGEDTDDDEDGVLDWDEPYGADGFRCIKSSTKKDTDKDGCVDDNDLDDNNDGVSDIAERNAQDKSDTREFQVEILVPVLVFLFILAVTRKLWVPFIIKGDMIDAKNSIVNTGSGDLNAAKGDNGGAAQHQDKEKSPSTVANQNTGEILAVLYPPNTLSEEKLQATRTSLPEGKVQATKELEQRTLLHHNIGEAIELNQKGWTITITPSPNEPVFVKTMRAKSSEGEIKRLEFSLRMNIESGKELYEQFASNQNYLTKKEFLTEVLKRTGSLNTWAEIDSEVLKSQIMKVLNDLPCISFTDEDLEILRTTITTDFLRTHQLYRERMDVKLTKPSEHGICSEMNLRGEGVGQLVLHRAQISLNASGVLCVLESTTIENKSNNVQILKPMDQKFWHFIDELI